MFNVKLEVFLPVSAVTGCSSAVSYSYILLMWGSPSTSANNAHDAGSQNKLRQPCKRNSLPKGFACCSTPARMLTPAGESLRWTGLGITQPYGNAALHLLTTAASWLVSSRRVWVHLHLFTHSLQRTSVLCLALLPSDLLVAARVIYEAVVFKV